MKQAHDYQLEAAELAKVLEALDDEALLQPTLFKGWTIEDVIGHLFMFDRAAMLSLESDKAFEQFYAPIQQALSEGKTFLQTQNPWLNGVGGRKLFEKWRNHSLELAEAYQHTDPKKRLKWAGPDMSARSSITARQMETWAHGQEVFDALGLERTESDRIENICHLGVATFGWAFANRKLPVPDQPPRVQLSAPSGKIWEWNTPNSKDRIEGSAIDFARVVTQVRNVKDTGLTVNGNIASQWMQIAQCFAGPPVDPPRPKSRYKA